MRSSLSISTTAAALLLAVQHVQSLDIDTTNPSSIKDAAGQIAANIAKQYNGNQKFPGVFSEAYYWWESGLAWDSLIEYWALTGDDTYAAMTRSALVAQMGQNHDFMPVNQTSSEGNDDQATWAHAAMTAAERQFPAPVAASADNSTNSTATGPITWLGLAQNVFDTQNARWDTSTCDGGLRWQIMPFSTGYNYKNAASNGNFALLAARLYRFTGNNTYAEAAQRAIAWSSSVKLLDTDTGAVFDGTSTDDNCKERSAIQWSSNLGYYWAATAYLTNASAPGDTPQPDFLANTRRVFLSNSSSDVLIESACTLSDDGATTSCNADQIVFRAVLSRALSRARALTPATSDALGPIVAASAKAAAARCEGADMGCSGSDWAAPVQTQDALHSGLGQALSALEVFMANLPAGRLATSKDQQPADVAPGTEPTATVGAGAGGPSPTGSAAASPTTNAASRGVAWSGLLGVVAVAAWAAS